MGYRFRGILFTLCLCVTIVSWGALVQNAQAGPQAVFDNPLAKIEQVPQGESIAHTFVVRNTGDAELQITDVKTG